VEPEPVRELRGVERLGCRLELGEELDAAPVAERAVAHRREPGGAVTP
jgi:hypothetical protein